MTDGEIERDGISWVRLNLAARRCGIKMVDLRAKADAGEIASIDIDGMPWIARGAVMKLKREKGVMRSVARRNAKPKHSLVETGRDRKSPFEPPDPSLPMTHDRTGQGWKGMPPRK